MNDDEKKISQYLSDAAALPVVKGPVVGGCANAAITPLLKWTAHSLQGEKMPSKNLFAGATTIAFSAVPGYGISFLVKAILSKANNQPSTQYDLFSSFTAGAISGFACTPFEALAQNKQLAGQYTMPHMIRTMRSHHGPSVFFHGGLAIAAREGAWSCVYMSLIPSVAKWLEKQGMKEPVATGTAVVTVAGAYGFFSAPLNQLRFRKQQGLMNEGARPSYGQHAKNMATEGAFFKAAPQRMLTATAGAFLVVTGSELYDRCVKK